MDVDMKELKRYYDIPAPPEDIYHALTNPVTLQLWTGEPAVMEAVPGTEFSLWNGSISGRNLEFEPGRKLVQQWYFGDQAEASVVTIILHPKGKGTSVELIHTNIPDKEFNAISRGWNESYFGVLQEFYR
jgi:uncharacterized protein YndB with AHSA1/START domain